MAIHLIPVVSTPTEYTMGVTLDDKHYLMHVYWNDRDLAWYFDMAQPDKTPIIGGVKIVLGAFLGRTALVAPFTTGVISAIDTSGTNLDAGIDELGGRVLLFYIPSADLLAVENGVAGA